VTVGAAALRRTIGIILVVVGVVAGIALWLGAGRRYDNAVASLAPAPIGCDTTLVFDRTGTYTFFVETTGEVAKIDGDCASDARSYDVDSVPRVTLTLVDAAGGNVDLQRTSGPTYDRNGRQGEGIRTARIDATGSYTLTARTAGDTEAVIRVGHDPSRGVAALRIAAVLALLAGVIAGVVLIVQSRRPARQLVSAPPVPTWPTGLPTSPPLGPPSANPPIPPPYTPRPASYGPPPPGSPSDGWPAPGSSGPPAPPARPPGGWPGRGGDLPPPSPPSSPSRPA
jgi:hypothetical protein